MPAAVYVDTHGGTGVGGSDDHDGVDIGRAFTEVPAARTLEEFLRHLHNGDGEAGGEQGSAARSTHAAWRWRPARSSSTTTPILAPLFLIRLQHG